jgi:hypothetical protein
MTCVSAQAFSLPLPHAMLFHTICYGGEDRTVVHAFVSRKNTFVVRSTGRRGSTKTLNNKKKKKN